MPVFERKEFFLDALESALNQTVKCEVIVIDNCSSHDYFEKVCKEKKVTYYRNKSNIGMARNFAKGFELSNTPFVMNLQDDDQLAPNYVEAFQAAVREHPDIDIFFTDFIRLTNQGKLPHKHTLPFGYMEKGDKIIEYGIKYRLGFPYMASAIKRTKMNGFDKYDAGGCYDWAWVYSEADKFSFYGDPRQLYIFREHENQDTQKNSIRYVMTIPYIYEEILQNKVSDPKLKQQAAKAAFWELIHLKSLAGKQMIRDFLKEDTVFSNYLSRKIKKDIRVKILFLLPKLSVYLFYKSSKKTNLV
ncbi:glycosyltransferase family 2 protein [Marivirga sp.]|uniref:glycosyltransferase family 2 protein n=1 Tax=Marivirga sp. TaxID=2018662 RepID=UPI0025F6735F|nr:glycosyltransferase family 2 protein [Marivirga sp.]